MSKYYKCPKCKGKGYFIIHDWARIIFTFGMGLMDEDKYKCDLCNGKGYLED